MLFFLFLFFGLQQQPPLLQRGLLALKNGQLTEARRDLEGASQADPQNPYVWSSLAQTYLRLKMPEQASAAARTAEQTGANDPLVCHALALFYSETGQPGRAAEFEEKFAESPGADRGALGRAASLYLSAGEAQRALPLAEKTVSRERSPEGENLLGRTLIATGREDGGVKHLGAAWQEAKTDERMSFDYAEALLRKQQFTEAAEVLASALSAHGRDPQLTLAFGVARYGQRRFDDAITAFLKVIELDSTVEQPYLFLGRTLEQAGEHMPEIIKAYENWAARESRNAKAQLLLAKALLAADHRSERAGALLQKSIALDGSDWESHYQLGLFLADKRDWKAAEAELSRSVALSPQQPLPHYHLARVYDRLGQGERAAVQRKIHAELTANNPPQAKN